MKNLQRTQQHAISKVLRKESTDVERRLWTLLRSRQLMDFKFRRQHAIGPYVVDFFCASKKLVIELDGSQHFDQIRYDEERTKFLEEHECRVLRFWNNDVIENAEGLIERVLEQLQPLTPTLSPLKGAREIATETAS